MENVKIARVDTAGNIQSLEEHLLHTADFCRTFLESSGFGQTGYLLGLLHDLGKYSPRFQNYIRSVFGLLKEGDPGFLPNAEKMRGHIPHAEAGLWYLDLCFRELFGKILSQDLRTLLGMPVLYHHAFPADVYAPDGETPFLDKTPSEGLDSPELFDIIAPEISTRIRDLIKSNVIITKEIRHFVQTGNPENFDLGLLLRLLYSALIDADRTDAAGRTPAVFQDWQMLTDRLEKHLSGFTADSDLNKIRRHISQVLKDASDRPRGVYRLTIPTGGGKTLAGLRFALHHAAKHGMKRVIYAAPFLSILEQNARVFRESMDDPHGQYVLECHSNVLRERAESEEPHDALAETWDAPVICTTMVQILNAMFSGESRFARRFHQFADSVILLDEIQSLPMEMFHIFNRTVNFFAERMHATVILCSATQPELTDIDEVRGNIRFSVDPELYPDYPELFRKLRRVDTCYLPGIRSNDDIAAFAGNLIAEAGSLLVICNTKPHAAEMFRLLKEQNPGIKVFHLSTNLCAAHRRDTLKKIKAVLNRHERLIAVSTSLIEAGVDISFAAVIRLMTSLDSIVQAAGRCNRNAEAAAGKVCILDNPESLRRKLTPSVEKWSVSTGKALRDYSADPERFDNDILSPALLNIYYTDLFSSDDNKKLMAYPVKLPECKGETLLNLLGGNDHSYDAMRQRLGLPRQEKRPLLRGAFRTAGEKFEALKDLANTAVVVPYGEEGKRLVAALCALPPPDEMNALLKAAQMFTVNITDCQADKLHKAGAIREIRTGDQDRSFWIACETGYDCCDLGLGEDVGHWEYNEF